MRTETAAHRLVRGATGAFDRMESVVNRLRIASKDRIEAKERVKAAQAGISVQERQQELVLFYEKYEDLVELLCDAAQFGPTPNLERRYAEQRAWMARAYPALQPYVVAFLRYTDEDDQDAFLALVSQPDLGSFLQSDDGNVISRITRTREALNLYAEHLRQLSARVA